MKSYVVHLKNKFPNGTVIASEKSIDVYVGGEHIIAMRLDGGGSWADQSESMGLSGRFCLAPIPKDSRVHKLFKDGKMGLDDRAEARKAARSKFQCKKTGKIKSIEELSAEGFQFDAAGVVLDEPKAKTDSEAAQA